MSRGPLRLGLLILLAGLTLVYLQVGRDFEDVCGIRPVEGSSHTSAPSLWPPGTFDCEYVATSGAVVERHPFPWLDLLVVLGVAVLAASGASALRRRRASRRRRERPGEPRPAPARPPHPPP